MTFRVVLSPAAARELRKLNHPAATPLVGRAGMWRIRTGDYRLLYEIHDDELLVLVIRVAHRRDVYDR